MLWFSKLSASLIEKWCRRELQYSSDHIDIGLQTSNNGLWYLDLWLGPKIYLDISSEIFCKPKKLHSGCRGSTKSWKFLPKLQLENPPTSPPRWDRFFPFLLLPSPCFSIFPQSAAIKSKKNITRISSLDSTTVFPEIFCWKIRVLSQKVTKVTSKKVQNNGKNTRFYSKITEILTLPTFFIAFLCINFFQNLKFEKNF